MIKYMLLLALVLLASCGAPQRTAYAEGQLDDCRFDSDCTAVYYEKCGCPTYRPINVRLTRSYSEHPEWQYTDKDCECTTYPEQPEAICRRDTCLLN